MHPVSLFPSLFNYDFLAIFVLRGALGILFLSFAYTKFFRERAARIAFYENLGLRPAVWYFSIVSGLELLAGILLTIGLFTQAAALVTGVLMLIATIIKWRRPDALPKNTIEFYLMLAIISFAVLCLGPGPFAFDYPL